MKAFLLILIILIGSSVSAQEPYPPDTSRITSDSLIMHYPQKETNSKFKNDKQFSLVEEFGVDFDELAAGPRVNYMQGKDGFLGLAFNVGWHETEFVPKKHIGFAVGSDFMLSKSFLMAPKVVLEYRYYVGILRLGYLCYTDFGRDADHRIAAEIGFSFLSFGELSYVHTFEFDNNPFNLGSDYFNLTISIPVIMKTL